MAQRYANVMRLLVLTLVFAPIVPLASFFGIIALGVNYWTDKALLLRRHSRPRLLSMELSDYIILWLPLVVLAYSSSLFVLGYQSGGNNTVAPSIALALSAIFWLFPMRFCLSRKPIEDNIELQKRVLPSYFDDYERNAVYFLEDYARANPVTAHEGWTRWLDLVSRQPASTAVQEVARKSLFPSQAISTFHSDPLYDYALRTSCLSPVDRPRKGQRFSGVYWRPVPPQSPPAPQEYSGPFALEIKEEDTARPLAHDEDVLELCTANAVY